MPVVVRKREGLYRVVEEETGRIAVTKNGNAVDGGGHREEAKAKRQAGYINASLKKREEK